MSNIDIVKNLVKALRAIADGSPISVFEDNFIVLENPNFDPTLGNDPNFVIDVTQVEHLLNRLTAERLRLPCKTCSGHGKVKDEDNLESRIVTCPTCRGTKFSF